MLDTYRMYCPAAGTFSKDTRAFWGQEDDATLPQFIVSGKGAHIYCQDGKKYLDWICALGANLLGYGDYFFNAALVEQIHQGVSFSLPTKLEMETARLLVEIVGTRVPGWSPKDLQVRFTKTGTECTMAAVRLARAVTGRDLLLRCSDSYLGWGDYAIATTPPALGIPKSYARDTVLFKYGQEPETFLEEYRNVISYNAAIVHNAADALDTDHKPAAVILEQGLAEPPEGWYDRLRAWCNKQGCLLILDETASGFRYAPGGAAEYWGIEPDLVMYGKALGNGVAISTLVGRREYMEWFGKQSPVFVSGTFCGETLGLAAVRHVLHRIEMGKVNDHLWLIGNKLVEGLTSVFKNTPYKMLGHGVRSIIVWPDRQHHAFFIRGMAKRGILMNRPNYTTCAHTLDDVKETVDAAWDIVTELKDRGLPEYKEEQLPRVLFANR